MPPNKLSFYTTLPEYKKLVFNEFEMPDKLVALLVQFLEQNNGKFSKRAREKEFVKLDEREVQVIEKMFHEMMIDKNN
jgi:TPP-dependent 2-oxoacid decarboxylase